MSFDYIRRYYGVPAKRGARVEYTGDNRPEFGTIVSASGGHLNIRLDSAKHAMPFHPTWKLRYLDSESVSASLLDGLGEKIVQKEAHATKQTPSRAEDSATETSEGGWLKPCPFCGGPAAQGSPEQPHGGMVSCTSCGAQAFGPKWGRRV